MTTQTEAQRLAEKLKSYSLRSGYSWHCHKAADELLRLESELEALRGAVPAGWRLVLEALAQPEPEVAMMREWNPRRMSAEEMQSENTRLKASLEECSGNMTALKDQVRRMRSELERPMSSEATVLVHDNARLRAEVQALRGAVPAGRDAAFLLDRYERQWHRMGELWERYQGKGWPDVEGAEFESLRDEKSPRTRAALIAMLAAAPQPAQGEK
jgi:hypothetical protein